MAHTCLRMKHEKDDLPSEFKELRKKAKNKIEKAVKDSSEYASMIRCAVRDNFRY